MLVKAKILIRLSNWGLDFCRLYTDQSRKWRTFISQLNELVVIYQLLRSSLMNVEQFGHWETQS